MAKAKKKELSKSAKYFRENDEAREKKNVYNKEYHSSDERKKYRAFLNKVNRKMGTYGNGDGLDFDHSERKMISASKNRAKK
jgi:hypothetical protein